MTLEAIAGELGIKPGTLYHYFEDKEALIFQCHQRGLRMYEQELIDADEPGLEGLEAVRRLVRRRLLPGRPRMIAFSDIDALSDTYIRFIKDLRLTNIKALQKFITRGIVDGTIISCDARLTAIAIFSILDWMPFWYSEHDYYTRQEAAEILDDLLTYGVIRLDHPRPQNRPSPPDLSPLLEAHVNMGRREAKRDRLLRFATESFNLKGAVGSSLESIAQSAGVSRGAYYYHARDKETLLYQCIKRAFDWEIEAWEHLLKIMNKAYDGVDHAVETEIQLFRSVYMLHDSIIGPKSTYHNINFLAEEHKQEILGINHLAENMNRTRYKKYITKGIFRDVDTFFIQQIGAGLRNNLPVWRADTRDVSALQVADNHVNLFLFGLKPRRHQAENK